MSDLFKDISEILRMQSLNLAEYIKQKHGQAGQIASGRTRDSITASSTGDTMQITARKGAATYMERGRKPGRVPHNFVAVIHDWMISKGLASGDEQQQLTTAWMIADSIAKNGTRLYQQGGTQDVYTKPIERTIPIIEDKILFATVRNILEEIEKIKKA